MSVTTGSSSAVKGIADLPWFLIWLLSEARYFAMHVDPRQRVITKNLSSRFSDGRLVKRTDIQNNYARPRSRLLGDRRAALGAEVLRIGLPLPPRLLNVLSVPSIVTASLVARTSAAKALPVNFWQSRQWHTVAVVGSTSAV
jgi:hypothetical protein